MKIMSLKHLFLSNAPLKIICLALGYTFWHIATTHQIITLTYTIPVCFEITDSYTIAAPETINVTLQGKRIDLYALDSSSIAAHINARSLHEGRHGILLNESNLFLPQTISLVRYKPSNIMITITKN